MTLIKEMLLALIGLCAGGVIAAGVYAFLAIIGVFTRLMGKTGTKRQVLLYESLIVLGGILGNVADLYEFPIPMGETAGLVFLGAGGLCCGVFVGCLAMSLAETLKALPTIHRRIGLSVGLPYLIAAIAAGKLSGSLVYFWKGMAAP